MVLFTLGANANAPFAKDTALTKKEIKKRLFTPEIMLKMGRVNNSQLCPNGRQILYTVNYQSVRLNRSFTGLWIMDKSGENARQVSSYELNVSEPRWSDDGLKIYFLAEGEVYSINTLGKEQKKLTSTKGEIRGFGVSPNGQKIWVAMNTKIQDVTSADIYPELKESKALIYDDLMARHWDVWEDGEYSHIYVGEVRSGGRFGKFSDIMSGEPYDSPGAPYYSNSEVSWSSDSRSIAYTCRKLSGYEYAISTNTDIYLYDTKSKKTKNLTEGMEGYDKYPVFSPDGKYMVWQSMERAGNESDIERLYLLDLQSGEKRFLSYGFGYGASRMQWSGDSRSVLFISAIEGTHQICSVDIHGNGGVEVITEGLHDYVSLSVVGRDIVAEKTSLSMASEIFQVNVRSGESHQLSFVNQHIYDNVDMGEVRERWVGTSDGKRMLTWVVLPPGFVEDGSVEYPALLYCQGGPQSVVSQFWSYRWNFQLMAAQGYVVVAPNRRGVPSFGKEWLDQISGDYSGQNISDYLRAIDDVSGEVWVDTERLGCVGASYGGYSVYYLAGCHDGRFKSFISHCGIFDFTSMYGSTEELWFVNRDFGGAYWDIDNSVAQRSYAHSPHHFVQNWDTPMLIITGLKDYRIPYTQSLEAFTAARSLGIESRLVGFEDEGHQVFQPQNSIVWHSEFFDWLNKYLK